MYQNVIKWPRKLPFVWPLYEQVYDQFWILAIFVWPIFLTPKLTPCWNTQSGPLVLPLIFKLFSMSPILIVVVIAIYFIIQFLIIKTRLRDNPKFNFFISCAAILTFTGILVNSLSKQHSFSSETIFFILVYIVVTSYLISKCARLYKLVFKS